MVPQKKFILDKSRFLKPKFKAKKQILKLNDPNDYLVDCQKCPGSLQSYGDRLLLPPKQITRI